MESLKKLFLPPKRGTSSVPTLMGVLGAIAQINASMGHCLCAKVCDSGVKSEGAASSASDLLYFMAYFGFFIAALGFTSGLFGKKYPMLSGLGFIIAAILSLIPLIIGLNLITGITFIFFVIGGVMAFSQEKVDL